MMAASVPRARTVAAAAKPAGPAPTMTTSSTLQRYRRQRFTRLRRHRRQRTTFGGFSVSKTRLQPADRDWSRHGSRGFRDASHLVDSRRACPRSHSPGSGQPTPRRHAARTALPTKRATFTTCARGQARCACWLAIGSPDPGCSRGSQGIARRRAHGCSLQQLRTERRRGPQLPQFRQGPASGHRPRRFGWPMNCA
jgi:hypothetical protein